MAEGFDFGGEAEVFGSEEEGGVFWVGGEALEGDGVWGEGGSDEGVGFFELVEIGDEIGGLSDGETEEVAGGGADRFGVVG